MNFLRRNCWVLTSLFASFLIIGSAYVWMATQLRSQVIDEYIERARITETVLRTQIRDSIELFHSISLHKQIPYTLENPEIPPPEDLITLAENLSQYTKIDQIRLILPNGDEHLRVNDQGSRVGEGSLQNKFSRTYFQEAMQLSFHTVYLSGFDLNIENDEIETPIKPTVRLASPVQGSHGQNCGLFVINFKLNGWFSELTNLYPDATGQFHILDQDGYYLYTSNPELRWGRYLEGRENATLAKMNPELWAGVQAGDNGVMEDALGIAVWRKINLDFSKDLIPSVHSPRPQKVILYRIPASIMAAHLFTQRVIAASSFLLFSCALLGLHWLYKERRAALNTAEEAFDHAAIGMALVDSEGNFIKVNHSLCSLIGYSATELEGRNLREITHPDDVEQTIRNLQDLWDGKCESCEFEKRYLHQDGREISVLKINTAVKDANGRPRYLIIQVRDLSERILHERELIETNKNLTRSNQELEQFAYVASHDLQEPLRMVANYTQLLAERYEGKLDEKADKYIYYAVSGAKRMQSLINDLLAYSRVGTRKKPQEPVDCGELIHELRQVLFKLIKESETEIITSDLPVVMANRTELSLVFQNLISNAIKFRGDSPSKVEITAARENGFWKITVKDDGIGIDPQYHDQIFTIFQRLHKREEYEGSGIGLSIVKKIIESHGGNIRLESRLEKGSSFIISLPAPEIPTYERERPHE